MDQLEITIPWDNAGEQDPEAILTEEWLVANGLGGYASGTVCAIATRRYHGLLISALPAPLGRMVMLGDLAEEVRLPDRTVLRLGGEEKPDGSMDVRGRLKEFRLEAGLPVWVYNVGGFLLEKRVYLPHMQNTVHVSYRLLAGEGTLRLRLRPLVHFRPHEAPVNYPLAVPYVLTAVEDRYELSAGPELPSLRLLLYDHEAAFTLKGQRIQHYLYRLEEVRGYEALGDLWSPGYFAVDLQKGQEATMVASTESWETINALKPAEALAAEHHRRQRLLAAANPKARDGGIGSQLILAADQFIITPAGRMEEEARARASGDEVRTVIAGYHWFTDWGRDTMISLEGLTLSTGRWAEAGYLLRTFAQYIKDGLIPNLFPEGHKEGLYHTADATLWYFHALHRYLKTTSDRGTMQLLLPRLIDIVHHHLEGTLFGIGVDPEDGLLRQGQYGYQLTWMDAKVGEWVVTPRRGKAVEINALWYNALKLLERWVREERGDGEAQRYADHAEKARASFNRRFWYPEGGYLYDVVDGEHWNDSSCRPNQLFAISLDYPILDRQYWESVMQVVMERLVTPVGVRSLAPGETDYKPQYYGDRRSRDAAYHQGTVWAWLIGPFVDAWLKLYPGDKPKARRFLTGFDNALREACVGSISEVFDAEKPYTPRGCIAQAWSVAEVLRCWIETAE